MEPWAQRRISTLRDSPGEYVLDDSYRGYAIRITRTTRWDAVLVEVATGQVMPTKATALLREGRDVAIVRARALVDVYANAEARRVSRAA